MKSLFLSFLAATAVASPALAINNEHQTLIRALDSVGVEVQVNPVDCFEAPILGFYEHGKSRIGICMVGRTEWTAEDYDTLRHEAHHVVQNCMSGSMTDGKAKRVFDVKDLIDTANQVNFDIAAVEKNYRVAGVEDDDVILQEMEAYLVAYLIPPDAISNVLKKSCQF